VGTTVERRPSSSWRSNLAASGLAFATYFCMYAFRKPFAAASFEAAPWLGLDLKTLFVTSQVLGYTVSKYLGIKWVSEVSRARRLHMLLGLIAMAELSLLGFAVLPAPGKVAAIFCNGLPLGMIWGLLVRYLEGRRASELLLSGLSCSFIIASGIVKDVGRWLMASGVPEYWMPAAAGLLFVAPLVISATLLDRMPDPDREDEAEREARPPMRALERRAFARQFLPGLILLGLVYLGLTAFRDFRDNYGIELFAELGYVNQPALFSRTELPVALCVLLLLGTLSAVRQRLLGLWAVFGMMIAGLALVGVATLALDRQWLQGQSWMVCVGLGGYLAYVPFSSFLFDRIMAATRFAGTAVFAVNLADAVGYSGSVGMLLYKDLLAADLSRLSFFKTFSYALSLGGCVLLLLAATYFSSQSRRGPAVLARGRG
jgi:hypothetical protein